MQLIGVNAHRLADADDTLLRNVTDGKIEPWFDHVSRVETFKRERDVGAVSRALAQVVSASRGDQNLVPVVIEAFDASATVGEIVGAMRLANALPWDPFGVAVSDSLKDAFDAA